MAADRAWHHQTLLKPWQRPLEPEAIFFEIDVHESADGHIVLMHDEAVDRTSDGSGNIEDMSLETHQGAATWRLSYASHPNPARNLQGLSWLAVSH